MTSSTIFDTNIDIRYREEHEQKKSRLRTKQKIRNKRKERKKIRVHQKCTKGSV